MKFYVGNKGGDPKDEPVAIIMNTDERRRMIESLVALGNIEGDLSVYLVAPNDWTEDNVQQFVKRMLADENSDAPIH